MISGDMTINEIIRIHPETMEVLNRFDVDLCCGGHRTIAQAAEEEGLDVSDLLGALNAVVLS